MHIGVPDGSAAEAPTLAARDIRWARSVYDFGIRDVVVARGATPEPDVEAKGVDVLEEFGGAPSRRA